MKFPPKSKQGFRLWTIGSIFGLITLGILFFAGRYISDSADYFSTFALLIFMTLVIVTGAFLYVLRSQIDDGVVESYLNNRINELEEKLETVTESSEHKSIYLENMSHEIRIPLSTIMGMIRMLKNTDLDSDQQAQLEIAEYSSEHLLQLINMILNNSKSVGADLKIEQVPIRLKSDFTKLFKIFEYQAWENNLEFSYKFLIDKKQDFLLLGDISKIQQVLINIVNNAIKFTNSGKIEITIDHKVTYDNLQVVSFYIKDTGIGMSDFEQNQTLKSIEEKSTIPLKHYRGSGIGLAASKKLIELMGGELKFESKENEGSTFYFSLQMQKTLNVIEEPPKEVPILLNKYDYKFSVLVAEDNKMNQKVLRFLLEQHGAECTFVTNGLDAVNLYKVINFDMVFMDIYMPKINGYEATKIIKNSDKYQKNNIPIVAVSASAFDEDIKKAKVAGVDEFLAKPIDSKKLNSVLRKYALKKEEQVS
ncbi:response regulator [Hyunsoonleella ulvae]|uniref:response regulator n=1 Tax=Hyunsoonleella ulvae TaxID=2799948 RepID=UPI00193A2995|nr:response regulator [Hyunsoonleella ulvae]